MKYKDILEKHIYYVDFEPVRFCEFNGNHQALVLKKNPDKQTLIVVPLTTDPNGRKVSLGKISSLPEKLRDNITYASCNQVRTVNYKRFNSVKDDSPERNPMNIPISNELFKQVLYLCTNELTEALEQNDKVKLYQYLFHSTLMVDIINIAYEIKRLPEDIKNYEEVLRQLQYKIVYKLNQNVNFIDYLDEIHIKNGIGTIIQDSIDNEHYNRLISAKEITDKKLKLVDSTNG